MTHDLIFKIFRELGATIEKVIIDKLEENTFYAKIVIKTVNGELKSIDARPSDSIALAVRARAPIFVEDAIIRQYEAFNKEKL